MRVLGKVDSDNYVVQVSHSELEKVAAKYYGEMKHLDVGADMNLGAGYDYTRDIRKACEGMESAMQAFETAQKTMLSFAVMVANLPPTQQPE